MPCNTIQTNTVNLENIKNLDLLEKALREQFVNVYRAGDRFVFSHGRAQVVIERGRATSTLGSAELGAVVGMVKQAYSREAVKFACKRFGWATVKGADVNHFAIRKG